MPGTNRALRGRSRAPVARTTAVAVIRSRPVGLVMSTVLGAAQPVAVTEVRSTAPARMAAAMWWRA
ncbi:hypothetical protein GCM10017744_012170 [Streptomyces antimycoticus]